MCNATVTDIPLKRNLHVTGDISESRADLRGAFLVLLGICAQLKSGRFFFKRVMLTFFKYQQMQLRPNRMDFLSPVIILFLGLVLAHISIISCHF